MTSLRTFVLSLALLAGAAPAMAQNAFSYQGRLTSDNFPVASSVDMRFTIMSAATGGGAFTSAIRFDGQSGGGAPITPVDGLFTVPLDFAGTSWSTGNRWLRVEVRPHDEANAAPYVELLPRQQLTVAPQSGYSQATRGFTVDSQTRIGVGTAAPSERIEVTSGNVYVNGEGKGVIVDAQSFKRVGFMNYAGYGTGVWRATGVDFEIGRVDGASVATAAPSFTDFYVAADGNVGIGTTTTPSKLTVGGVIESTAGGIKFPDGTVQTTSMHPVSGDLVVIGTINGEAGVVIKSGGATQSGTVVTSSSAFSPVPGTTTSLGVLPPGKAMVNWSMTCYSNALGSKVEIAPQIGAATGTAVQYFFNVTTEHLTVSGTAMIDVNSADPVDFRLVWRIVGGSSAQVDTNDSFSWTVVNHRL